MDLPDLLAADLTDPDMGDTVMCNDATRRKDMRRRFVEQALLEAEILATVAEIEREGVAAYVKRHQAPGGKR